MLPPSVAPLIAESCDVRRPVPPLIASELERPSNNAVEVLVFASELLL
jgi:hypothetical protein